MSKSYIYSEFSINPDASGFVFPEFCRKTCSSFFAANAGSGEILKKFRNTRAVYIEGTKKIDSLVIRNSSITYWSDLWFDQTGSVVDPKIKNLSLQNNLLTELIITENRSRLKYLDLTNNFNLTTISIPLARNMEVVKLNNISSLVDVQIGRNSQKLRRLEIKNCSNLAPGVLSSFVFSTTPGFVDLSNTNAVFSTEDVEVLEFLNLNGYRILGVDLEAVGVN